MNHNYPEKTTGSEIAAKVRSESNKFTRSKRQRLTRKGMWIINHSISELKAEDWSFLRLFINSK